MATLVIMAAGLGSRFSQQEQIEEGHGGNKQISYVDEYNNCIMHYSIHDAIKAGFDKIILVIRRKDQDLFHKIIGNKFESKIKIEYAYQESDELKESGLIPIERTKPLGTTHAVYCAKDLIKDDCYAVINADDFYGYEAFKEAISLINTCPNEYSIVVYKAKNVLSNEGPVKRGVCLTDDQGKFIEMKESSVVRNSNGKIIATPLNGEPPFEIEEDTPISMSFFILPSSSLQLFGDDIDSAIKSSNFDKLKGEVFLPESINNAKIKEGKDINLKMCSAVWMGLTYKEDLPKVRENLSKLKNLYTLIQK